MRKRLYCLLAFSLCIFFGLRLLADNAKKGVCFGENCFMVEVARTNKQRAQGLMFRDYLDESGGMLFVFPKDDTYGFWMKNTKIPLDIIWFNFDKEVVFIKNSAQPCETNICSPIFPDKPARYVLEVNAGSAARLGIRLGDKASFDIK
jgi:uncharacterized protein